MQTEPVPSDLSDSSILDRIDILCDEFEQAYQRGERPDIRSYLERCETQHQPKLLKELLLVDRELRQSESQKPTWEEYLARLPEFKEQIETVRFLLPPDTVSSPSAQPQATPSRIAHFELLERIGIGGLGVVWRATDTRLRRVVALKVPKQQHLSEGELSRFLREGQTAAQLSHAGIVPVYEVGRDGDVVFIATAYIAGGNLCDWLAARKPVPWEAAALCVQIAEALHHAHQQGVVHRDLKPANILMDPTGRPYVSDFGLAKWDLDTGQTLDGELLGTLAYMSPEQASGKAAQADRRSDVYSLGVILYEMLTGQCPFQGKHPAITYDVVHRDPATPRSIKRGIPKNLETICLKALQKSPDKRYASAQEMADDLQRYMQGKPIRARRAGFVERSWRWVRRKPARAALIVVALIAASAAFSAFRLAGENKSLLGLRTVRFTTSPAGAQLGIARLNKSTGEPIAAEVMRPDGLTPLELELKPGDYLVVAKLDDVRFHEVYRRVPEPNETAQGTFMHLRWRHNDDDSIDIPQIAIPTASVTNGMVLVSSPDVSGQAASPASLYVDDHAITLGEIRAIYDGEAMLDRRAPRGGPEDRACINFDRAVAVAEKLGKRLPSEAEFELIFTRSPTAGESEAYANLVNSTIAPGQLIWTTSCDPRLAMFENEVSAVPIGHRVVRGVPSLSGQREGEPGGQQRTAKPRMMVSPDLGMRCVRSRQPRYLEGGTGF